MEIFVTGASGFIGTHLVRELLKKGMRPICHVIDTESEDHLRKEGVELFCKDISTLSKVDAVVHLAGRVHQMSESGPEHEEEYRKVNVDFALDVARRSIKAGAKRFVFMSTVNVYGDGPGKFNEESPTLQKAPYGLSKTEAESKLRALFNDFQYADLIILRAPMVFGPGNKGNMLPFLNVARKNLFLPLGCATKKRSILYIENLVSAIMLIINTIPTKPKKCSVYNLKDNDVSSKELYEEITEAMYGTKRTFCVPEISFKIASVFSGWFKKYRSKLFGEFVVDDAKFRGDYAWVPPYTLKESIKKTVEWFVAT